MAVRSRCKERFSIERGLWFGTDGSMETRIPMNVIRLLLIVACLAALTVLFRPFADVRAHIRPRPAASVAMASSQPSEQQPRVLDSDRFGYKVK
jgi:hypothetical protein